MYGLALATVLVSSCMAAPGGQGGTTEGWSVVTSTIHTGGCAVLEVHSELAHDITTTLVIDGRVELGLGDLPSPVGPRSGRMYYLVSHDLKGGAVQVARGDDDSTVRLVPLFEEAGEYELRLEARGVDYGVQTINVLPAPRNSDPAVALLYPAVQRGGGVARGSTGDWLRLIVDPSVGVTPQVSAERLTRMRTELALIRRHPDWAGIAELLFARLEARSYLREVMDAREGVSPRLKADVASPILPEIAEECRKRSFQNPLAAAIRDDIQDSFALLERLKRNRARGE